MSYAGTPSIQVRLLFLHKVYTELDVKNVQLFCNEYLFGRNYPREAKGYSFGLVGLSVRPSRFFDFVRL